MYLTCISHASSVSDMYQVVEFLGHVSAMYRAVSEGLLYQETRCKFKNRGCIILFQWCTIFVVYQVVSCLYQACIMLVSVRAGYMTVWSRYMQDTSLIQVEKIPDTESFFQIVSTLYQHRYKRDAERIRTLIFGREPLKPHVRYRADTHKNTRMHVKNTRIHHRYMPIHLYRKRHQFVCTGNTTSPTQLRTEQGWVIRGKNINIMYYPYYIILCIILS